MKGMSGLVIAVLSCGLAVLTASRMVGQVRLVDVMTLFGTGFAAGAGLIGAILRRRLARRSAA
jgi:hypothetical protein